MSNKPTLSELATYPRMTRWFNPVLLCKLLLRVIIADVFGQYADRRLMIAALDTVPIEELLARCDLEPNVTPTKDELWVDYVADLGDGFDATYAIAYLLAQDELAVDGRTLPRGEAVIMGGDEVYPTATRSDYQDRMQCPYRLAFPNVKGTRHPWMLMIPGNHDWYDGLVLFLALFCRTKQTPIGHWRTRQRRSYFALRLTERWWLWAIDIALTTDMDQPQADYFVRIAQNMPEGSHIILCSAQPGWYDAEKQDGGSYRPLSYAAWIAQNTKQNFDVSIVLSGDTHHYSRYASPDHPTQFITTGGGGAFLHGTHSLPEMITAEWLTAKPRLTLKTEPGDPHRPSDIEACYPTREQSRAMLWGDLKFPLLNPDFSIALGAVYWLAALPLQYWAPDAYFWVFVVLLLGFGGYTAYQEGSASGKVMAVSVFHVAAHFLAIASLACVFTRTNAHLPDWLQAYELPFWLFAIEMAVVGGIVAGLIFGVYLLITSRCLDMNHNDAFSAMRLDSHRHFLRLHLKGDSATIYAIGIDKVPRRNEWIRNPDAETNPSASVFQPSTDLAPRLIEEKITIRTANATPVNRDVAKH